MKFEQHGLYSVEVRDHILIVDGQGPYNDEALKSYSQDVKNAVQRLCHQPWGQLVVLRGLSLFTPEAEQLLLDVTRWRAERNLVASAVVMKDIQAEKLVKTQLSGIYQRVGLKHAFFDQQKNALEWLKQVV